LEVSSFYLISLERNIGMLTSSVLFANLNDQTADSC
jgi:hypothetical protein